MEMELREFDYSVRVNLASSTLCAQQEPSVALKLQVADESGKESDILLELNEETLQKVLQQFAKIRQVGAISSASAQPWQAAVG